jgi:CRP/FNR family cyclic AMP-dependent transcriptional regulator
VPDLSDDLSRVPLFAELSRRQLRQLGRSFKEREFRAGTSMVRQGEMSGVDFFVIVEGEAAVTVDGKEVGKLGPGDHFGELALIAEQVRAATVTAATPLRCLVMASWDLRRFVRANPDVAWKLLKYLVGALLDERSQGLHAFRATR